MNIIELYIDGKLCDTGKDFGVRLNRQLLNPAELNAKDAQYSYSITLPPTAANNAIFGYSNIEETKDKFNKLYNVELYVNSIRIFKGNFRPSEISNKQYKGNLYIPAAKSIKDIFGDLKLAENPEYRIEFKDFAEYISKYNKTAADGPQMAIFPYALYGVLPKVPIDTKNNYSDRNVWDNTVRMGIQDLAPSINPLLMLKHIFDGRKLGSDGKYIGDKPRYKLGGTAFDDERLTRLYMSYKNEIDYVQPWNYGHLAFMKIRGSWSNVRGNYNKFERNGYQTDYDGQTYYSSDLLDATNTDIDLDYMYDPGTNILYKEIKDQANNIWTQCQIRIPSSGLYKVRLKANLAIDPKKNWRNGYDGMQFVGGDASGDDNANSFRKKRYEIKLLRDRGTGDFGLSNGKIDRVYYRNNLNQSDVWNEENLPKYFPYPGYTPSNKEREILIVDPAQNPNYLLGMAWGNKHSSNPLIGDNAGTSYGTVLAAKTGLSWDVSANPDKPTKLGLPNVGYMKYGRLNIEDEGEDPSTIVDFSGGDWVVDKALSEKGNITNIPADHTSIILRRFLLSQNSTFELSIPTDSGFKGKVYIHNTTGDADPKKELEFNEEGKLTFESLPPITTSPWFPPQPQITYLTLYLSYNDGVEDGVDFDISEDLEILRIYSPEDIIDWEQTNKYKINLDNAPESYARRSNIWNGEGEVNAIVWLEAGEILTIASVSDEGRYKKHSSSGKYGWTKHAIDFELDISPFRINEDWLQVNSAGNGTGTMNWNDPINFDTDSIDLVKFLPADVKTDDFIENFCKAFNLILSQTAADSFTLNVKQTKAAVSPLFINLDGLASVKDRANSPLGLPSMYKIGFTVDQEEEGYVMTGDDGGGSFETGAVEESIVEQKSNFSYNWFKEIQYTQNGVNVKLPLPVISKNEVWADTMPYPDAMAKRYTNLAARFWYFDGLLNNLGADFRFNKNEVSVAKVTNTIVGLITLNYKDEVNTILGIYFTVLVNSSSHYTEIEGYLTPEQYEQLDGAVMAMFNGDQYYVAEISGYDPLGRNKTKIKLIRKI